MFTLGLKLNYDPSHLVALGIDPIAAVKPYISYIAHVQAKDTQILPGEIVGWVPRLLCGLKSRVPAVGEVWECWSRGKVPCPVGVGAGWCCDHGAQRVRWGRRGQVVLGRLRSRI